MRKITADYIYPVTSSRLENAVIVLDDTGKILEISPRNQHDSSSLEYYKGSIIPGFVNAHCHLELSHMKAKVNTGTGLISFISSVINYRDAQPETITKAIQNADEEMWNEGIMAVGDISNTTDTFFCKKNSSIRYATFVEMFDSMQSENAEKTFKKYKNVFDTLELKSGDTKSLVPHAPYSVSVSLFEKLKNAQLNANLTVSIHNQETPPENQLFLEGTGAFMDWLKSVGSPLEDFEVLGKTAIHYALQHLSPSHRNLFVHNTLTSKEDIKIAQKWSDKTYWVTCPNANLYIENRLPKYQNFLDTGAKMCIGTDSLTSNWQLSILAEMKTIYQYQSFIPFETLLEWATLNGAKALGFDDNLGSLEKGKQPGILLLENFNGKLQNNTNVKRIL